MCCSAVVQFLFLQEILDILQEKSLKNSVQKIILHLSMHQQMITEQLC